MGHAGARVGLEAPAAAVAVAALAAGIADVVEVQPVDVILGRHLQHAGRFQLEILRVGGAEPVVRLAGDRHLEPAFASHPFHKIAGGRGEVVVHFPDVDFDPVGMGRRHALGQLVAPAGEGLAAGQHVAGVMRHARPEHVGKDHVEPGVR